MPEPLTLNDLASQLRQLSPPLKGILALVDGETRTLLDLRVDTFENIVALLDGWGALEKQEISTHPKDQNT